MGSLSYCVLPYQLLSCQSTSLWQNCLETQTYWAEMEGQPVIGSKDTVYKSYALAGEQGLLAWAQRSLVCLLVTFVLLK